jgi:hypothetical protein
MEGENNKKTSIVHHIVYERPIHRQEQLTPQC